MAITGIQGGELNQGLHEFKLLIDGDCLDKLQPDVTLAGGIGMARKVATLCEERFQRRVPVGVLGNCCCGGRLHSIRAGRTTRLVTRMKTIPITNVTPRLAMPRCDEKASAPKLAMVVAAL